MLDDDRMDQYLHSTMYFDLEEAGKMEDMDGMEADDCDLLCR